MSYEYLAGWVWYHEIAHSIGDGAAEYTRACTGIVAQAPKKSPWHGGNMDHGPPGPQAVRNITLQVKYTRGGSLLFQGVDWYWFSTGVTRAVRKGVGSFQEDWRGGGMPLDALITTINAGVVPQTSVFRQLLSDPSITPATPFSTLVQRMATIPMAAAEYIIMAGAKPGDGAVIARNTTAAEDILMMDETDDKWFVVNSNYDRRKGGAFLPDR